MKTIQSITGITVSHNTTVLLREAIESIRGFHPDMPIIIIDGSDRTDECYYYASSLNSEDPPTRVFSSGYNIGHGRGLDFGISLAETDYVLVFDSDIVMLKSPLQSMLGMFEDDTYGVGYCELTGLDGFEFGVHSHHLTEGSMKMLHPYFALISRNRYYEFSRFVHHGAPGYKIALDLHERGLTEKVIKEFPGLGHSAGIGHNWIGEPREFIKHDHAGTRMSRRSKGQPEIEGTWEY
jgi:hypothetical protein